jgi:hypothetical protein
VGWSRRDLARLTFAFVVVMGIEGCGLTVPDKDPFISDAPPADPNGNPNSYQGALEGQIVAHIKCEIRDGLWESYQRFHPPWLLKWGTSLTLTLTFQDQSGLNPGISLINPYPNAIYALPAARGGNVVTNQSFSVGLSASGTASAQRVETVQFTYSNSELLVGKTTPDASAVEKELEKSNYTAAMKDPIDNKYYQVAVTKKGKLDKEGGGRHVSPSGFILNNKDERIPVERKPDGEWPYLLMDPKTRYVTGTTWTTVPQLPKPNCDGSKRGILVDSDLKIKEFIYDKITATNAGVGTTGSPSWAQFNTFTETITFTVSYGGNATPTWKFARISGDPSSTLLSATRTDIDTAIITIGPIETPASPYAPAELKQSAQNQHNAAVYGTATANGINGTSSSH